MTEISIKDVRKIIGIPYNVDLTLEGTPTAFQIRSGSKTVDISAEEQKTQLAKMLKGKVSAKKPTLIVSRPSDALAMAYASRAFVNLFQVGKKTKLINCFYEFNEEIIDKYSYVGIHGISPVTNSDRLQTVLDHVKHHSVPVIIIAGGCDVEELLNKLAISFHSIIYFSNSHFI